LCVTADECTLACHCAANAENRHKRFDAEDFETALFRSKYRGFQDIVEYLEPLTSAKIRAIVHEMMNQNQPQKSKKSKKQN
jgi:hypothetical protein